MFVSHNAIFFINFGRFGLNALLLLHSHTNLKFIRLLFLCSTLVMLTAFGQAAQAAAMFQVTQQQDSLKKEGLTPANVSQDTSKRVIGPEGAKPVQEVDSKIEYAADSTKYSKDGNTIYLYGNARVIYQDFELDADFISFNSKTNLVFAKGRHDKKGKYVGKPIFKMETQGSSIADSLFYNTKTGKGNVYNTFMEQEGGFFSGGQSKRQPDNEIHVKGVTYSTCNLPHPHFGLVITKGIVTDKQIITGPVYLKIEDIPTPLVLPFAFFPKPNKRSSGVIIPSYGDDYTRGFFLRDGGYYLNLNDYWDAKILGTIYTRGSYGASLTSQYVKRYKYNGNLKLDYGSNRFGLEGTPENEPRKDFSIQWAHTKNANASPGSTFSGNVNIKTSGYNTNTAGGNSYNPQAITENILQSSINYGKTILDGKGSYNVTASHYQNTESNSVNVTLPSFNMSVNSFSPFVNKNSIGEQKWYQKITLGYSMQMANSISTLDSLLFTKEALNKLQNGIQQVVPVSINFTALKNFNFNAGTTYTEKWHFSSIRQVAVKGVLLNGVVQPYTTKTDTVYGFNRSGEYSINAGVSTKIYNTLQFKNWSKLKALRWVMTPNVSMNYRPDFSAPSFGNYKDLKYQDGSAVIDTYYGRAKRYSIHSGSLYGGPGEGESGSIGFGIDNTVEAKVFSSKDTTGTGTKKLPIIQGLGINGSYNFLAPSFKLSTLSFSGRSQFTEKFGITYDGTLNPYAVGDSILNNIYQGKKLVDKITLPRLTRIGVSFGYSLNADAFKKRNEQIDNATEQTAKAGRTPEQVAALARISSDPNAFVDFNIPWNFTFAYRFDYSTQPTGEMPTVVNTLTFNGDFNVTPKWKVQFNSGYDFKANTLSYTTFSIYRDMHCWDMSINWVPIGTYRSYSLTIKVKASVLQDLKLSKQQAYYTRF